MADHSQDGSGADPEDGGEVALEKLLASARKVLQRHQAKALAKLKAPYEDVERSVFLGSMRNQLNGLRKALEGYQALDEMLKTQQGQRGIKRQRVE